MGNRLSQRGERGLKHAFLVTAVFFVAELVGGWLANSLALLADAGHMLTDLAAISLSLVAVWIATRPAGPGKTYGYLRAEILAALLNGVVLVLIAIGIFYEAYRRLLDPPLVKTGLMLAVASLGLSANIASALLLKRAGAEKLNIRGALLHVTADAIGSAGAIVAGLIMLIFRWYYADPLISMLVGGLILYSSWSLLRDAVDVLLEAAPSHVNIATMRQALCSVNGVDSVHDLHVWTLTSGMHAMSCHAVIRRDNNSTEILEEMSRICRERFNIEHTTIQLEEESQPHNENNTCH